MFVCNCTRFVANMIVYILHEPATPFSTASKRLRESTHLKTPFAQELIPRPEGNLDNSTQFRHFSRNVVLNVRKPLEMGHFSSRILYNTHFGERTSKYAMSCFTIIFHAENRSMRMSEGRRSCGAMFFLMRLCCLDTVEPCRLLARDVARDIETESLWRFMVLRSQTTATTDRNTTRKKLGEWNAGKACLYSSSLSFGTIASVQHIAMTSLSVARHSHIHLLTQPSNLN